MGRGDGERKDWPPALICRGYENEVTNTSYQWFMGRGGSVVGLVPCVRKVIGL